MNRQEIYDIVYDTLTEIKDDYLYCIMEEETLELIKCRVNALYQNIGEKYGVKLVGDDIYFENSAIRIPEPKVVELIEGGYIPLTQWVNIGEHEDEIL